MASLSVLNPFARNIEQYMLSVRSKDILSWAAGSLMISVFLIDMGNDSNGLFY